MQTEKTGQRTKILPSHIFGTLSVRRRVGGDGALAFWVHLLCLGDTFVKTFLEFGHVLWWRWWVVD
jgi:hypothetical protein